MQAGRPTALSWLRVTYPPERKDKMVESRMGLCVKPLHNQYNRALWLVEFIQFYNLLGVNQFVLYNQMLRPKPGGRCPPSSVPKGPLPGWPFAQGESCPGGPLPRRKVAQG